MKKILLLLTVLLMNVTFIEAQTMIPGFPTVTGAVYSMTESGGILYIGGYFSSVGGEPRQNLAAIDMTTYEVLSWAPDCDSTVRTIRFLHGRVYICGLFQHVNGAARNTLAALDPQTGDLLNWNPVITFPGIPGMQLGNICTLDGNDTTLFIGGYFLTVDGAGWMNLAALNLSGHVPPWWSYYQGNLPVNHVTLSGSTLYVDYVFNFYGLDIETQQKTAWNPNPNIAAGGFTSLYCDGGRIYIAGPFDQVGSAQRAYIAQTKASTGQVTAWNAGFTFLGTPFTDHISSMVRLNDKLVVTGGFQQNTSQSYDYMALYDTATGQVSDWNPLPDGPVWSACNLDGLLLLGGAFTTISGQSHPGLALYDFTAGIPDPGQKKRFLCYPNPADDLLTIRGEDAAIALIQVVNSGGTVVNTIKTGQTSGSVTVNVAAYPPGLYFFRLLDRDNRVVGSEKIIIR